MKTGKAAGKLAEIDVKAELQRKRAVIEAERAELRKQSAALDSADKVLREQEAEVKSAERLKTAGDIIANVHVLVPFTKHRYPTCDDETAVNHFEDQQLDACTRCSLLHIQYADAHAWSLRDFESAFTLTFSPIKD